MLSSLNVSHCWPSCLLVAFLFFACPIFGKELDEKAPTPKGRWNVTAMRVEGVAVPKTTFAGWNFVFEKDVLTLSLVVNEQTHRGKFDVTLNPHTSPSSIDAKALGGRYNNKVFRGIYKLEGNTLTLCFPDVPQKERPGDFSAKKGSPFNIYTLSRSRPE